MKKQAAALLDNPMLPKRYSVTIETSTGGHAILSFTNKDMALSEYNRIKNAGIYCGHWIKEIDLDEQYVK